MTPLIRLLVAGLLLVFVLNSLATNTPNPGWSVRVWQSDDGLPNNTVTGLAQTADGYLWIASPGPFARFDGVRFEQFTPSEIVPGYHQNARALLQTCDGSLWMAMAHGPMFCLKNGEVRVFTNNLPDLIVQQLLEDSAGAVWMNYPEGRLCRIKDGVVTSFSTREGWPEGFYSASLASDAKGGIWFVKRGQVGRFRNERFETLPLSVPVAHLRMTGARRSGGFWMCSGSRLFRYDEGGTLQDLGMFQAGNPNADPTVIFEDGKGDVWIGTDDQGLFHYGPDDFQSVPTSHPQILSLTEDREGNLWVGTGGGGLNRVQACTVRLETAENGLSLEGMRSLCEDQDGSLWAVTQNSVLVCRTTDGWNAVSTNSGWSGEAATCVAADAAGAVWVATRNKLHRWQKRGWTTWANTNGLVPTWIHALLVTAAGDVWVGGYMPESLQRLRNGEWHTFQLPKDAKYIRAMAEDTAGNVWIGTSKGLLFRATGDRLTDETARTFGVPTSIRGLHTTPDGSVWIACAGGGLGWINKEGRFARIMAEHGLYDNYLSQVISDNHGWLWFGSDHGIFKARQRELEDVALGRAARVQCIHFGRSVGLPSLQANFGDSPIVLRARNGQLWMPMRTALAVVNTPDGPDESKPPPVLLKRVAVDEQRVASYDRIIPMRTGVKFSESPTTLQLSPKHHRLEFEYTALSFSAPENVNFRYRMEGLEENWIEAGAGRSASYSRLSAGNYRFQVKARNGDGAWSESPALAISVAPFLWQTWWFRIAAVGIFTGGVIATVRYVSFRRLRLKLQMLEQQAALDKERARIARDIHDDLGGSLTQVALLSGLVQRDWSTPEKAGDYVQRISATAHQAIRSLDEIVWAVNPRNDTVRDLINYLGQFTVEFLRTAGIQCQVDLPNNPPHWPVSAEVRHNLFLVVKETLHNITRHARASEVLLGVTITNGSLRMSIEDNGQGFENLPENAFADGLRNIHQRMAETGGRFEIESVTGKGTRVSLVLPCLPGRESI